MKLIQSAMALAFLTAPVVVGQQSYVPELVPREGEQRLNRFQYHSVHNSFVRGNTLAEQVDAWGAFQLELDVWYDNGGYDVQHNSCDTIGEDTLENYLADLGSSVALQNGFIFLDLQLHDDAAGPCSAGFSLFPSTWVEDLRVILESFLGADSFYTFDQFEDDQYKWPSLQELSRRGKHILVFKNSTYDDFYFNSLPIDDCSGWDQNPGNTRVKLNTAEDSHCWNLGDRWVSRHYPTAQLCFAESDSSWSENVDRGFTFVATNCDEDVDRITDSRLHPPNPLYVAHVEEVLSEEQLGTWRQPYSGPLGLILAVTRIREHQQIQGVSNVEVVLQSGGAHTTVGLLAIDPPFMTLTTRGGPVTLSN